MDIYTLVAANLYPGAPPLHKGAKTEDRYYAYQVALPRLRPGLVGSVAACALVILVGLPLS